MSSADVGVLGASAGRRGAGNGGGGGDDASDSAAEPTCLYDVYNSVSYAAYRESCGHFCASDIADGTTLTPALPTTLGLRVTGVGDLPLPLSEFHAKALKSNPNTRLVDQDSYHKVYSVDSRRVKIKNPAWAASLDSLVRTAAYKLGVKPECLSAKFDKMLLFEKVGEAIFVRHVAQWRLHVLLIREFCLCSYTAG